MNIKRRLIIAVLSVLLSIALLVATVILAENSTITPIAAVVLTLLSVAALFAAIFYAARLDYETGNYECRKCANEFRPPFGEHILGPHTLTTRYLRCPACKEKSWCRRKSIIKNNKD